MVRAWCEPALHGWCRPVVVGHPDVVRRAVRLLGVPLVVKSLNRIDEGETGVSDQGLIHCWNPTGDQAVDVPPGINDGRAGQAACEYLSAAAAAALDGHIDAITTAPLSKAALHSAGLHYPGHTEILAELCAVREYAMMLYLVGEGKDSGFGIRDSGEGEQASGGRGQGAAGTEHPAPARMTAEVGSRHSEIRNPKSEIPPAHSLGVVHVTLHTSIRNVPGLLSAAGILEKIRLIDRFLRDVGGEAPRIGVCALNPHAGEAGLFGDEERHVIEPAVNAAAKIGIDCAGPLPADTLLKRAAAGEFDGVVAMYHDQGHIALKLIGWERAVNVTLGLPIVRTSPSHGTAFDIAWKGRASGRGMIEAVRVAAKLARSGSA